jgi:O-antigen/teichoic acid export membrane protein
MRTSDRVAKNAVWVLGGQVVAIAVVVPCVAYIARRLGTEDFGFYGAFTAWSALLSILGGLGFYDLIVRDGARAPSEAGGLLVRCLAVQMVLLPVQLLMVHVVVSLGYGEWLGGLGYLAAVHGHVAGLALSVRAVSVAHQRLEYSAIAGQASRALCYIAAVVVLLAGGGLVGVALSLLAGPVSELVLAAAFAIGKLHLSLGKSRMGPRLSYILTQGLLYYPQRVLVVIRNRSALLMLPQLGGSTPAGWYKAAKTPIDTIGLLPTALGSAAYPALSRLGVESKETSRAAVHRLLRVMFALAIPVGVSVSLLAEELLVFLFGAEYLPATPVLATLGWAFAVDTVARPLSLYLNANALQRWVAVARTIAVSTGLALTVVLFWVYGVTGAAIAVLLAYVIESVICYIGIAKHSFVPSLGSIAVRPLIAGGAMAGLLLLTRGSGLTVAGLAGALGYAVVLVVIGGVDTSDWRTIGRLLPMAVVRRVSRGGVVTVGDTGDASSNG